MPLRLQWQDAKRPPAALRLTYLIAQKREPQFRRAFTAGARDVFDAMADGIVVILDSGISVSAKIRMVLDLYPDPARPQYAELWVKIMDRYRKAYAETVEESAESNWRSLLVRLGRVEKRDAQRVEETREYVETKVGDRIVAINAAQKNAIRVMVQAGIDAGRNPKDVARNIREVIGLLPRDVELIERRRVLFAESGLPASRVDALATKLARQKLRERAERIARTEMIDAESFGRLAAWKEAQRSGLIRPDAYRVWIASGPPRTCPICEALDGTITERLGGDFSAEYEKGETTVTVIRERPPAHPMCRCTDELVIP